jgi:hypothetical protein
MFSPGGWILPATLIYLQKAGLVYDLIAKI